MKQNHFRKISLIFLLVIVMKSQNYAQICTPNPFSITNTVVGSGLVKQTQNTYVSSENPLEFYIYDDGTYSDYNNPTHRFVSGVSNNADAFLLKRYSNGPKKFKVNNPTVQGSYYQDVFPVFSGPLFMKTSWSHAVTDNNNCHAPYYILVIQNCTGNFVSNGHLEFFYKSSQSSISTGNPIKASFTKNPTWFNGLPIDDAGNSTYDKKIKINFQNLQVNERRAIYVALKHNDLPLNSVVETMVNVNFDNVNNPCVDREGGFPHTSLVKAFPHDPNNVEVIPSCLNLVPGASAFEKTRILYTINYQNEGIGFAENIKIVDFLSQFVDPSSAYIVDSKYVVTDFYIDNNQNAVIKFDGVNLAGALNPFVIANNQLEKTKGWVKIAVCTKPNLSSLAINTINSHDPQCIDNYAAIYFDTQPAVYTGMATTCESLQCTPLSIHKTILKSLTPCLASGSQLRSSKSDESMISPNPFSYELSIFDELLINNCEIGITNLQGQKIYTKNIQGNESKYFKIDTENFNSGLYIITIKTELESKSFKVYKN
jgi:hypothetical protein